MNLRVLPYPRIVKAASLEDAYKQGYFTGSISRWDLEDRILKYNPDAKIIANKTHRGLWIRNKFILGITYSLTIPKFTIMKHDSKFDKTVVYSDGSRITKNTDGEEGLVLARSWISIIEGIRGKGYEVDTKGLI